MFIHLPYNTHKRSVSRRSTSDVCLFAHPNSPIVSKPNVCTQNTLIHSTYASNNASDSNILSILMLNMHCRADTYGACMHTHTTQLLAACMGLLLTEKQCRIGPVTQRKTFWAFGNKQEQQQITKYKNYRHTFTRSMPTMAWFDKYFDDEINSHSTIYSPIKYCSFKPLPFNFIIIFFEMEKLKLIHKENGVGNRQETLSTAKLKWMKK